MKNDERPLVMHLLRSNSYLGAEGVALQIMRVTSDEYDSVYVSPSGPIKSKVESEGMKFCALRSASHDGVRHAIQELRPSIIHAHYFTMATLAAFAKGDVPVVAHLHQNPPWLTNPFHPKAIAFACAAPKLNRIVTV